MTHPYPAVPDGHPFKQFLWNLPDEPPCSPRPDIIEEATSSRFFVAHTGQNSTARMNRFLELLKRDKPACSVMSAKYGPDSAQCTMFLNRTDRYVSDDGKVVQFVLPIPSENLLDANPPFTGGQIVEAELVDEPEAVTPSAVLPGVKQMESY